MKAEKYIYTFSLLFGKKMAIHHMILVILTKCMTDSLIAVKEFVQIRRIVFKQGLATSAAQKTSGQEQIVRLHTCCTSYIFIYNSG